ncbi:acyl-CoA synthetase (AMP-forming)/AMP-acid ligase II [Nocardia nova SH22a]|uniref:Acyl-CoA synthetase (AMP-forming)/AMP-acid ligase II n=1 Tax=Nocardia nova SH22a TaxID=1415166 RepID=W5TEN5_9NOCA|nr:AMP-binding protein [Nocardia nova]AHH17697.1 acyl-CoA synthetase (AMP-forming)/AMP-acid ligase II [Nocardia nova SH22a]
MNSVQHPNSGAAVDISPARALRDLARHQPAHPAVRYAGGDLDCAGLDARAARFAALLEDLGVGAGDRVAYLGLNSPAFLVTMFGAFRIGAVFVPVNFRLAGPELAAVLARSGATVIVCEDGHRDILDAVRVRTSLRHFLIVADDPEIPVAPDVAAHWRHWPSEPVSTPNAPVRLGFDDPAIIMFTSGTTGLPKGVVLTHGNIWWNGVNVDSRLDTRRGDITHAVAPLFHVGGLNALALRTLVRGGTVVVRRSFEPEAFLADLVHYRVNSFFAVPAMLAALARVPGVFEADLTALRTIVVAGAPVPPSLIELYATHGIVLQQAWGLTETAPFATHLPAEHTLAKLGSAGIPMPHTEIRIVDAATGDPVEPGASGEILVRGPNVTPGYFEDPAATAAVFDADGWFHSGDIGRIDADGCLYIVDRLKDMIISGGENVYPAEVERALADLPGLVDVAVVGAADERWGETVIAVVAFGGPGELTLETVRAHAATTLARYKLPRRLALVPTVPRNASGKLDKIAIGRMLAEEG